jgi:hypothetical protein
MSSDVCFWCCCFKVSSCNLELLWYCGWQDELRDKRDEIRKERKVIRQQKEALEASAGGVLLRLRVSP